MTVAPLRRTCNCPFTQFRYVPILRACPVTNVHDYDSDGQVPGLSAGRSKIWVYGFSSGTGGRMLPVPCLRPPLGTTSSSLTRLVSTQYTWIIAIAARADTTPYSCCARGSGLQRLQIQGRPQHFRFCGNIICSRSSPNVRRWNSTRVWLGKTTTCTTRRRRYVRYEPRIPLSNPHSGSLPRVSPDDEAVEEHPDAQTGGPWS